MLELGRRGREMERRKDIKHLLTLAIFYSVKREREGGFQSFHLVKQKIVATSISPCMCSTCLSLF